jgi:GNAT superfamily N-acetyltransferase
MNKYIIEKSTRDEAGFVDDGIVQYNLSKVPFTQDPPFIQINRVIKDPDGKILAGINSVLYCWKCLYIDILWVSEDFRKEGLGTALLEEVEKSAKEHGCYLIHLDTFDFQAKDFYIKNGFQVFAQLNNCPPGHIRYYMKKDL